MNKYRENGELSSLIACTGTLWTCGKIQKVGKTLLQLCLVSVLSITALSMLSLCGNDWVIGSSLADSHPKLGLNATGPNIAGVGQPLVGINVRLTNPGLAAPDSKIRIFIHDKEDRDLRLDDFKIDVREGDIWKAVPVEAIDGGVMGAIGADGKPHNERHKRGGFSIGDQANKLWHLRLTFRVRGHYSMVFVASPDNGATHLAQPVGLSVEAL
jgi:hypothetical protein